MNKEKIALGLVGLSTMFGGACSGPKEVQLPLTATPLPITTPHHPTEATPQLERHLTVREVVTSEGVKMFAIPTVPLGGGELVVDENDPQARWDLQKAIDMLQTMEHQGNGLVFRVGNTEKQITIAVGPTTETDTERGPRQWVVRLVRRGSAVQMETLYAKREEGWKDRFRVITLVDGNGKVLAEFGEGSFQQNGQEYSGAAILACDGESCLGVLSSNSGKSPAEPEAGQEAGILKWVASRHGEQGAVDRMPTPTSPRPTEMPTPMPTPTETPTPEPTATAISTETPMPIEAQKPIIGVIKADMLNIREGPGTEFYANGQASKGVKLHIVGKYGNWLEVKRLEPGMYGWVYDQWVDYPQDNVPVIPKNELPAVLPVEADRQDFSLSCESSAAGMLAKAYAKKHKISPPSGTKSWEDYLVSTIPRDSNPNYGFRGEVTGKQGLDDYGVYAEPVAEALRKAGIPAEAKQNLSYDDVVRFIQKGYGVVVWVSYWKNLVVETKPDPKRKQDFTLVGGEHAITVYAAIPNPSYEPHGWDFFVVDPLRGKRVLGDFARWEYFNNMTLIVGPLK